MYVQYIKINALWKKNRKKKTPPSKEFCLIKQGLYKLHENLFSFLFSFLCCLRIFFNLQIMWSCPTCRLRIKANKTS